MILTKLLYFTFLCQYFNFILSEITIVQQVQTIYDRAPKLRIRGVGFDAPEGEISIDLAANGEDPLRMGKDFILSKPDDSDGIILKLLGSRK